MSESVVAEGLARLVTPVAGHGDWDDVLRRAGVAPQGPRAPAETVARRRPRRRVVVGIVALAALLGALLATPAFGVQRLLLDLLGRKNVSFANSASAPNEIKKQFEDLSVGAPAQWAPEVIAGQARVVATFSVAGHPRKLWVAPTRRGGYCYTFEDAFGGCRQTRATRRGPFSATWVAASARWPRSQIVGRVGGDITNPGAARIVAAYADGATTGIPFIWVSRPISAGFFSYDIPVAHRTRADRLLTLTLYDAHGRKLGRQSFPFEKHPPHRVRLPLPRSSGPAQRALPTAPPAPAAKPLQQGEADGFRVVAGHNGSVQFTQTGSTPILKRLVGHSAGFSCFRLTREFGIFTVRGLGDEGRFAPSVGFRLSGVGTPLDGCEVEASIGRTWPDSLDDHAAVEIPLSPAGRRFFADRAAARDLALFVRSRRMHALRREDGTQLLHDVRAAYPQLAHSRIRIAPTGTGAVYSERSPTGRRFEVTVSHGRIVEQNLKPYAFVF